MASEDIRVTLSADINDLQRAFKKATGEIDNFQKKVSGLAMKIPDVNTSSLQKSLNTASKKFNDIGDRSQRAGQRMQDAFVPAAAASSFAIFGMIQNSRDFEGAVRRASVLTQGSYEDVKSAVLDMASTSVYTTSEVADAMAEMGAKGFDASKAIDALPGVLSAAAASGEDLALTADTITSALNAFSLDASESGRVADILAQAANQSAAGILDMQYAFKYAAGPAAQLGYSVEDLAAAVGIMVDAGLSGETAGTTLRASLLRLVDPPSAAAKELKKLGIATRDQSGEMKPLAQLIDELQGSMGGYTNAQKAAALSTIFGVEAVSGMMSLMSAGPDEIRKMTKALEDSSGASAKAADAMLEGWAGALTKMESSVDSAARAFTDALAPAIEYVAGVIKGLADWFSALPKPMQTIIASVTAAGTAFLLLGAILGVLINAWGGTALAIGALLKWVAKLGPLLSKLRVLLLAFTGPIGIAVLAIGALVTAFITAYNKSEVFRNAVNKTLSVIRDKAKAAFDVIKKFSAKPLEIAANAFNTLKDAVSDAFSGDFTKLGDIFAKVAPTIIAALVGGLPGILITVARFLPSIAETIEANQFVIAETINKVVESIVQFIRNNLPQILTTGVEILTNLINGIVQALPTIVPVIISIIQTIITMFTDNLPMILGLGVQLLLMLINGILSALPTLIEAMTTLLVALVDVISQSLPLIIEAGIAILMALIDGIVSILPELITVAVDLLLKIVQAIADNLPKIVEAGVQILTALIDGIVDVLPQLIEAAIMLIVLLAGSLIDNLPKIIDAGVKVLMALIDGIVKVLPQLIKAAIDLIVKIAGALIANLPQIIEAGIEIIWALIKGIAGMAGELATSIVTDIFPAIMDTLKEIDLWDIGKDIVQGLIDGIGSMASAVADTVSEMAGGIKDKIMDILGIHSPSRVMRDQVGKWIPIGLADGIDEQMRSVQTAANRMASTVIDSASLSKIDPQVSALVQSSATLEPASDEGPQIVNFERLFDGATINVREERDIKALAVELYNLQQNAKARKGVR